MELLFGIFALAISCAVVVFVTKFYRPFGDDADSNSQQGDEEGSKKSTGKKNKKMNGYKNHQQSSASSTQQQSGHKQTSNGESVEKPVETKKAVSEKLSKNTPLAETKQIASTIVAEAPVQKETAPLVQSENSNEVRRRKGSKSHKMMVEFAEDKENQENGQPEENIADLIMRASNAEKKLVSSEKQVNDLTSRIRDLEGKIADTERRLTKAKEDEVNRAVKEHEKKLNDTHASTIRRIETQLAELRKKCDEISQDKVFLQGEVGQAARQKMALEKEIQELKKLSAGGSPTKSVPKNDALVAEIKKHLPEFSTEKANFADSLQKHLAQSRKRTESEHEKTQSQLKHKLTEAEHELTRFKSEAEDVKRKSAKIEAELAKLNQELSNERQRSTKIEQEWQGRVSKQESERKETVSSLERQVSEMKASFEKEKRDLSSSYEHTIANLSASSGDHGQEMARIAQEKRDFESKYEEMVRACNEKQASLDKVIGDMNQMQVNYAKLKTELDQKHDIQSKFDQTLSEVNNLKSECDHLRKEAHLKQEFESKCQHLSSELDQLRQQSSGNRSEMENELNGLRHEKHELNQKIDHVNRDLEELRRNKENELNSFNHEKHEMTQKVEQLTREVESLRQQSSGKSADLENELNDKRREVSSLAAEVEQLKKTLAVKTEFETRFHQISAEAEELRREMAANGEKVAKIDQLVKERDTAENKVTIIRGSVELLQNQLKKERENVKAMESQMSQVNELRRSVDDLSSELAGEKTKLHQTKESRDLLEKTAASLEVHLREVEANLNETKAMYSNEVSQLRSRLETLTNELNEERQLVAKLRSDQSEASENCASSKLSKLENGSAHPFSENGNADEMTYLRDELTKSKLANSHAEEALLALQEELNVAMAKVLKMESDHSELQSLIRTGEEALKSEQARSEDLQRKVATLASAQAQ